jgi:hypothetical protein
MPCVKPGDTPLHIMTEFAEYSLLLTHSYSSEALLGPDSQLAFRSRPSRVGSVSDKAPTKATKPQIQ